MPRGRNPRRRARGYGMATVRPRRGKRGYVQRDHYLERWAAWLPAALAWLAQDPPNYKEARRHLPMPERPVLSVRRPEEPLRLALLTSSGAYDAQTHAPFNETSLLGDSSWRAFPYDLPDERVAFAHEHYDRTFAREDPEVVLPRRALAALGVQTTEHVLSWSGYTFDWPNLLNQTIPQMVAQVRADGANAALLVPV